MTFSKKTKIRKFMYNAVRVTLRLQPPYEYCTYWIHFSFFFIAKSQPSPLPDCPLSRKRFHLESLIQ